MKLLLILWLLLTPLLVKSQTIKGFSEDCIIYLTIENQKISQDVKSIDIEFSPDGLNFMSFDVLPVNVTKQEYKCATKNVVNYFRLKTTFVDGDCDYSATIKISNECQIENLL